jgi:hypothetical protein
MVGEQSAASHAIGHALRWSVWLASVVKSASSSARILGWISVALAFASTIERSHFSLSQQHVPSALTACPSERSPHRLFGGTHLVFFLCACHHSGDLDCSHRLVGCRREECCQQRY